MLPSSVPRPRAAALLSLPHPHLELQRDLAALASGVAVREEPIELLLLLLCPLEHVLHHLHLQAAAEGDGGVA